MKGKKWDSNVKIQLRCKWFNYIYASIELFLDEPLKIKIELDKPLKIIFLVAEDNDREVVKLINIW